jgi:predicted MPP superfamily phosphohydrolase
MRRSRWFVAAAAAGLLTLHMVLLASAVPLVRHLDVHVRDWPAGAPPLKLALLSDLHVATPGDSVAHLTRVVAQVDALHPDLVLIAGDFLSNDAFLMAPADTDAAIAPLAGLHAPLGAVAVFGNHDYADRAGVASALARARVTLLDNAATRRGPLAILGISDAATGRDREAPVLAQAAAIGGVRVVLTHSPDAFHDLPLDIDLALAGHTHCGQVALPFHGPLMLNLRWGRRYGCGVVRDGARTAVVTAGLGTSNLPIRLGVPPDLWVIDIGR